MTEEERQQPIKTASQRIAEALGRPAPRPLTDEEEREFWAEQARIGEELVRRYGPPLTDEEFQAYLAGQPLRPRQRGVSGRPRVLRAAVVTTEPGRYRGLPVTLNVI
jgi:hypothetical protein